MATGGNNVSVLVGANVYMDGQTYAGQVEEATMPDPKPVMQEIKALSMYGKIELPHGLDKMSCKLKWNSVSADIIKKAANVFNSIDVMIRSNIAVWANGDKTQDVPCVAFIRGTSKSGVPPIGLKHQDKSDLETEYAVTYYKLEIGGVPVVEIDFYANVYMVDGVDMLADYRANLGN